MATAKPLPRKFLYEGELLDDVDPAASPEEMMAFYSESRPALVGAGIEGPELTDDALVYKFVTRIGTKGAAEETKAPDFGLMKEICDIVLASDKEGDEAILPPSEALEVFG